MIYDIPIKIENILKILPHGYPFLLVDRVISLNERTIVAVKNVTYNEHHFIGHFPAKPIMPGVLILEALAQASAILASSILNIQPQISKSKNNVLLISIDSAKFKYIVSPGDVLKLNSSILYQGSAIWKFEVTAEVEDRVVSHAFINAMFKNNEE